MTPPSGLDRRALLVSTVGLIAAAAVGSPAEPASRTLTIRAQGPTTAFPHYWKNCVGSGHAKLAMRADWQRDLATVNERAGFESVRFHGLLNDDMGLCREIGPNGPVLHFLYVDQVFDAILDRNMKPFVELSFMPLPLASGPSTVFWYNANTSPPSRMEDWSKLVAGLAEHLIGRYGAAEVTGWRFECWNEPNWDFWAGDQAAYFALYAAASRALKGVDARLQVGGPATAQLMWIPEFLAFCAKNDVPVDFVSSHIYPDDPQTNVFGREMHFPRERVIPLGLKAANEKIARSPFPDLPLVISEWSSQNPAFIAEMINECAGLCDTLSYWTFDNVIEELGPILTYDNEFYGLLRQGGVARPSFHVFELMHRLGTERLATGGEPVIATRRSDGSIAVLAWNLITGANSAPGAGDPLLAPGAEPLLEGPALSISFAVEGMALRGATATMVDIPHDAASLLYERMGRPHSPTRDQMASLRAASALPHRIDLAITGDRINVEIPPNGVTLVELS